MFHSTTIVAVLKDGRCALAGDGQVTFGGSTVMKHQAKKVRTIYQGRVLAGFAGSVADSFTLFEKFEEQLEKYRGNLRRAAVELAREWRTDKVLRRLEALLLVGNTDGLLILSGSGEVIEPDDGVAAIGSGGPYALAAARALFRSTDLSAGEIARQALHIASEICVFTNNNIILEEI
ncbi:MAG: ATP-dependent protease subunit HslV [Dethiobacter sp.]|nr:ATP-dependent protease subunit HslV [Dethiobacter sp.]MCL5982485.1 ATP-dependent protease subunit HslV [Bacillota bacterium]